VDSSALPVIVLGVVLGGIAPDARAFQLWFWWLVLVGAVLFTAMRSTAIVRSQAMRSRAS
jgi:hypothetical protein